MRSSSREPSLSSGSSRGFGSEPLTTKAGDWWLARKAGLRLPEHALRCDLCREPSEPPVCAACIEHTLQSETLQ